MKRPNCKMLPSSVQSPLVWPRVTQLAVHANSPSEHLSQFRWKEDNLILAWSQPAQGRQIQGEQGGEEICLMLACLLLALTELWSPTGYWSWGNQYDYQVNQNSGFQNWHGYEWVGNLLSPAVLETIHKTLPEAQRTQKLTPAQFRDGILTWPSAVRFPRL